MRWSHSLALFALIQVENGALDDALLALIRATRDRRAR